MSSPEEFISVCVFTLDPLTIKTFAVLDNTSSSLSVPRNIPGLSELDFKSSISKNGLNIIAEIKKASPSEGIIRKEFNHLEIAKIYAECPVSAISVLTEKKYFFIEGL